MFHYDAACGSCRVYTFRDGVMAGFGHDLEIDVTRFELDVDERARTVVGRFDPTSLRVLRATRYGAPTSIGPDDRRTIERTIVEQVLEAARYPEIRFASSGVEEIGTGFLVKGTLALHGRERPLEAAIRREDDDWILETGVVQPEFGIKPYSALLGTLRVRPRVTVRLTLPHPTDRLRAIRPRT